MDVRARAGLAAAAVLLAGCAGSGGSRPARGDHSSSPACAARAGGRCAGQRPVHELAIEASGRRLVGVFHCGGRLSARETPQAVFVTYVATAVPTGGMACARVRLSVTLDNPLDNRSVIDTAKHRTVPVRFCHPDRRVSDDPLDPCW